MNISALSGFFKNIPAFWLSLLLPLVVLLYLLKLRREEHVVSSIFLWQKITRDLEANTPWQKLRWSILLLLQLLFLIMLIIAIARPFIQVPGTNSQVAVLIIDKSTSMAATDIQPNRLEGAKQTAKQIVEALPSSARVTVIAAGEKPHIAISLSTDRQVIYRAIDQISISIGGCNLGVALQIAKAIAERQSDVQTIILSDGNISLPEQIFIPGEVRFVSIGTQADNQAIQLLSVQINPSDYSISAFAQVVNFGNIKARRRLAFYADEVMVNAFDLDLIPNGEQAVLADGIFSATQIITAHLLPDDSSNDFLDLDNRAYAVVQQTTPTRVVLSSKGNFFLETALKLMPYLEIDEVKPGNPIDPTADIIIYDCNVPNAEALPPGNLFFISPPTSTQFFTITGLLQFPDPVEVEPTDPLIENVNLNKVNILDSVRMTAPVWLKTLIADAGDNEKTPSPLLLIGETDGRRIVVLTFDLQRSDFPLQIGFPILISNLVGWLSASSQTPAQLSPGAALALSRPVTISGKDGLLKITRPDGTIALLEYQEGRVIFADTNQPGIYTVDFGNGELAHFSVNPFSPQESNITPQESIPIAVSERLLDNTLQKSGEKELWRTIASLALLILILEWLLYHQAALAMVTNRLGSYLKKPS